jgi:hypothetical protein
MLATPADDLCDHDRGGLLRTTVDIDAEMKASTRMSSW